MMLFSIQEIKYRLALPLPGEGAHLPLSSFNRSMASEALKQSKNYKQSAVAVILFHHQDALHMILTQRQSYQGVHSQQVSFPGGKKENFETSLLQTALRESHEEIGLEQKHFELLGELTPVYIPVSSFQVQPFVFYYHESPNFLRQEREVAEIFSFPLPLLLNRQILKKTDIVTAEAEPLKNVPYFDIQNKIVWGATALILNEFKECLLEITKKES